LVGSTVLGRLGHAQAEGDEGTVNARTSMMIGHVAGARSGSPAPGSA